MKVDIDLMLDATDEAKICLNCDKKKCTGNCDRVRWERWKLKSKKTKKDVK